MTTPTLFILIDAAMTGGIQTPYSQTLPEWIYPLYTDKDTALIGPVLIDAAAVEATQKFSQVEAMWKTLKPSLHVSLIHTALTAPQLVRHLQQFIHIFDDSGMVYCLRFSDCRVLAHLPDSLTPEQWQGLTHPMTEWQIHQRDDTRFSLPLATPETQSDNGPWVLRPEQIEQMIAAGEADFLLYNLGYTTQTLAENTYAYWSLAYQCVTLWQKSNNGDREVLWTFGRKIFATRGKALKQRDWVSFLANAKKADILNT